MIRILTSIMSIILAITFVQAQGLLDKLKDKAKQEVKKLESTSLNQVSFIINKRVGSTSQCLSYKNGIRLRVPCPTDNSNCGGSLQCSLYKLREINPSEEEGKKYVNAKTETNKI